MLVPVYDVTLFCSIVSLEDCGLDTLPSDILFGLMNKEPIYTLGRCRYTPLCDVDSTVKFEFLTDSISHIA